MLRFQRTGLTTNTSNICKTNTPGLPGEDSREPNRTLDLRTRKHRCFLNLCSKLSMEITCHPLTHGVESLWVPCSAALWYLIKGPDVSAEKPQFLPGKTMIWGSSLCDLVIVTFVSHQLVVIFFLNHVINFSLLPLFFLFLPEVHSGFCLHYFSFNVSKIKKNVGKKNLDLYLVPHFRCKDSYSIDSKLFLLRDISFGFCATICMNSGTRRLYCDIINPYCYLKMIVCRTEDFHWCEAQFNE